MSVALPPTYSGSAQRGGDNSPPRIIDPLQFFSLCWPHLQLYDKQVEILYAVRDCEEVVVPAGHKLGKDFIAAVVALWFFCSRRPARVVTTSVTQNQLDDVLWGEIRRLIRESRVRLPIEYRHLRIRQVDSEGNYVPRTELVGQVVRQGEALLGRHLPRDIPRTLVIFDEASGVPDEAYESSDTWAHRKLIIGNPYPTNNFFRRLVKEGEKYSDDGRPIRKIIRIRAQDSPNVRARRVVIPGLLEYETYVYRRANWDKLRQTVGLDGEFYEDEQTVLIPATWIEHAVRLYQSLRGPRRACCIGVDPGEGQADTCWVIVDEKGVIEIVSIKTPDTTQVVNRTIQLMRKYAVDARDVWMDRGGGGKQHADQLRSLGYEINTVAFGESAKPIHRWQFQERSASTSYANRRAQLYALLRERLDPSGPYGGFALPPDAQELHRQLTLMPLQYDSEGRITLPPKHRVGNSTRVTIEDILGRSPDQADALALAVWGLYQRQNKPSLGAL